MALFTPVNQVRMTNVAVVRIKKGGIRFELACYPNKVIQWRDKIETDISEVLQIDKIFLNVSKGILAKKEDLLKAFSTDEEKKIVAQILLKGELQVSGKERHLTSEKLFKDIATIVAEKCIDPETKRPLTVTLVERAMKDCHYSVNEKKNAKSQALEVIRLLKGKIPIERAPMRLKLLLPKNVGKTVRDQLEDKKLIKIDKEELLDEQLVLEGLIDPGDYRGITELVNTETKKQGKIEVVQLAEQQEGETKIE